MAAGRRAGIDVGGTKCHGVVIDTAGVVVHDYRLPTPAGHDAIVDTLAEVAAQLAPFDSIGLGVPGLITRDGVIKAFCDYYREDKHRSDFPAEVREDDYRSTE